MKRIYWTITLLLLFSLALAACGGEEAAPAAENTTDAPAAAPAETQTETEEPTAAPTAVPSPTAEPSPTPEPEPAVVSFADLNFNSSPENLDSYRYEMVMTVSGVNDAGEPVNQSMTMQMAFTSDPKAASISMVADGVADLADFGSMEMVQIGDTNYIVIPEMGCMALPAEGEDLMENPMTEEFSPESMFGNLENLTLVGEEEIDGLQVIHYTFDETAVPASEAQGLESIQGDVFIAKEGGYLVRMVTNMQGDTTFLEGFEGVIDPVMNVEFNLKDVNQPFEIVPPAGCEGQGAGAESPYPVLEDATDLVSMSGIVSYMTAVSAAEAIEFYQNAMAEAGYTYVEDSSFISDTTAFLNFSGESGAVTVTISEDSGQTSITILAETQ